MKAKLIKRDNDYCLYNESGETIAASWANVTGKKLSKQNCDEIFGVIDVNMITSLLRKEFEVRFNIEAPEPKIQGGYWDRGLDYQCGVISGFNKAMELNKDKLFTIEDLYRVERCYLRDCDNDIKYKGQIVQRILNEKTQQPTEIEVEIEYMFSVEENGESTNTGITKLDENGCLILRKL
jgi:hypothetical protein